MEKIQIKVEIKNSLEIFFSYEVRNKISNKTYRMNQFILSKQHHNLAQTLPIDDHFDNFNSMKNMWHGMCSSDSVLIEKISLFLSLEYFSK